jgi:hypothetical protein
MTQKACPVNGTVARILLRSLHFSTSGGRQLSCVLPKRGRWHAIRSTLFSPSLTLLTEDYIIIIIVSKVFPNQYHMSIYVHVCPCQREIDAIRSTLLSPSLTLLTEDYIIIIVSKVLPNQFICTVCPLHNSLIYSLNAQGHTQFSKVQPITNELSRTCWRPKIVYQQYVCAYIPLPQSSK